MKKIYVTEVCKVDWDALPQDPTGHSMATNPWAKKPLLTASTMINSCLAWSAHQADSWWLWYMNTMTSSKWTLEVRPSASLYDVCTEDSIVLSTGSQKIISTASTDHWRSGPRQPSLLYSVCKEDHYCKSIHTFSHLFSHSNRIKQKQNWILTKLICTQ